MAGRRQVQQSVNPRFAQILSLRSVPRLPLRRGWLLWLFPVASFGVGLALGIGHPASQAQVSPAAAEQSNPIRILRLAPVPAPPPSVLALLRGRFPPLLARRTAGRSPP